jgi:hypothetical protein
MLRCGVTQADDSRKTDRRAGEPRTPRALAVGVSGYDDCTHIAAELL